MDSQYGFATEEDKQNAITTVALSTILLGLIAFKLAFNYDYTTSFLTGLAAGLGYIALASSAIGKMLVNLFNNLPYLKKKILGAQISTFVIPVLMLLLLWLFSTKDDKISLIDFTLAYSIGTIALLTPKRIYDDRDYKLFSFITTQSFVVAIFYSTIKFGWTGLLAWTAVAFIFIAIMTTVHNRREKKDG
jgi:hypothetical protein